MELLNSSISWLNSIIWSKPLVALCLGAGILFSLRTRFLQLRHLKTMCQLIFKNKSTEAGVSSFQALTMSLSGRVGTGNIAGVAIAITTGGPGAVFWMWVVAFLGAATSFIECTLAQIYKTKDSNGQFRGGPAYYIEKCMGLKWYAIAFSIVTIVGMGLFFPAIHAHNIVDSMSQGFGTSKLYVFIGIAIVLLVIVAGGVKTIARFTEYVVPFMAIAYIATALLVMIIHIDKIPDVFSLIIKSAFGFDAILGGLVGQAIQMGVMRGIYSNEAGQGTGPHAAAAADVKHPAEQGFVQAFSIYVDTLLVCSATAFLMLMTNAYNVTEPGTNNTFLIENVSGASGSGLVAHGVNTVFSGFGGPLVALALLFFAFTTLVANYYMAETNLDYLMKKRSLIKHILVWSLRVIVIASIGFGSFSKSDIAWNLADIGVGLMAWFNIIAIIILQKPALRALHDYEEQSSTKQTIHFDPAKLNISNADYWEEKLASEKSALQKK